MAKRIVKNVIDHRWYEISHTETGGQMSKNPRLYECTISFTYNAKGPWLAATEFMDNIINNPYGWFVGVKHTNKKGKVKRYVVDLENKTVEDA